MTDYSFVAKPGPDGPETAGMRHVRFSRHPELLNYQHPAMLSIALYCHFHTFQPSAWSMAPDRGGTRCSFVFRRPCTIVLSTPGRNRVEPTLHPGKQ